MSKKNKRQPLSGGKTFGIVFGASILAVGIGVTIVILVNLYFQWLMLQGLLGAIPSGP